MQWSPSIFINVFYKNQSSCIITFTDLVNCFWIQQHAAPFYFFKPLHFEKSYHCFQVEFLNNKSFLLEHKGFLGLKQMLTFWKGCHWLYRSLHNRHFLNLLKSVGKIAITTGLYSVQQCCFLCRKYLSADETVLDQGINHIQWNPKYSASRKNCFWQCRASQKSLLLKMQETQQ